MSVIAGFASLYVYVLALFGRLLYEFLALLSGSLYQCIDGFDVCVCDILRICTLFTIMLVKIVRSGRVQSTIMPSIVKRSSVREYERQVFW